MAEQLDDYNKQGKLVEASQVVNVELTSLERQVKRVATGLRELSAHRLTPALIPPKALRRAYSNLRAQVLQSDLVSLIKSEEDLFT